MSKFAACLVVIGIACVHSSEVECVDEDVSSLIQDKVNLRHHHHHSHHHEKEAVAPQAKPSGLWGPGDLGDDLSIPQIPGIGGLDMKSLNVGDMMKKINPFEMLMLMPILMKATSELDSRAAHLGLTVATTEKNAALANDNLEATTKADPKITTFQKTCLEEFDKQGVAWKSTGDEMVTSVTAIAEILKGASKTFPIINNVSEFLPMLGGLLEGLPHQTMVSEVKEKLALISEANTTENRQRIRELNWALETHREGIKSFNAPIVAAFTGHDKVLEMINPLPLPDTVKEHYKAVKKNVLEFFVSTDRVSSSMVESVHRATFEIGINWTATEEAQSGANRPAMPAFSVFAALLATVALAFA